MLHHVKVAEVSQAAKELYNSRKDGINLFFYIGATAPRRRKAMRNKWRVLP